MVIRPHGDPRYERDYSFSKALWDVEAAPALSIVVLAFVGYVLWRLVTFPIRIVKRRRPHEAPEGASRTS